MLTLLNILNFALIDELRVEFDRGLNLLTGETGSGKSIVVDALGVLVGGKFSPEMIKSGESRAYIEGLFSFDPNEDLEEALRVAGIEMENGEVIIRRELAAGGRGKIFINNQLATQVLLRDLRPFLVDIHGQGDQQTLFNPETHLVMLDSFAGLDGLREEAAQTYRQWAGLKSELAELLQDEADRFQLLDILQFQIDELNRAALVAGEDERLEEERRRLTNGEKLSALCTESYGLVYEEDDSAVARIGQACRRVEDLAQYDSSFRNYIEGLQSARALLEDLAYALRDYSGNLDFSPERLGEVENRLAELSRLKRKYGGSIESALDHLARSEERLRQIEHSDERERELGNELEKARRAYLDVAMKLHGRREKAARDFEKQVVQRLSEVAMEHGRLEVKIAIPDASGNGEMESGFTQRGIDRVEFYFSANPGEPLRPLAKVASGGEASRLMLILKTIASASQFPRTIVFDEVDTGIGGRVSEAVGLKLKKLSETNQVLCVTHQPQIARFADSHLLVRKEVTGNHTGVSMERLDRKGRVEEIARMLTGADITETARRHAREMLRNG